jgi:PAS domain S-box-containing protein
MAAKDDEDELLRSVALRNAQSVLHARRLAEQELVSAKEALERKTTELAHSLAMMRATLESTTDGILVTDGAGKVTDFNRKYEAMWQVPRAALDSRNHRTLLEVHSRRFADPRQLLARVAEIYATSPPETFDLLELADGRAFERCSRIQFVDGRNVGRVWSFRDITERRQAEQALQRQTEWLRVTLFSIGDAVITTGADGRVASLNPVAEALTGWAQTDARGMLLGEVFHIVNEQTRLPVENPATKALQEGRIVGLANHTVLIAKDGSEYAIDDSAAPIRDDTGTVVGAVLIFRDITARRRDEVQARQSAAQFRQLADALPQIVWTARPDGFIDYYNERWYEFSAFSRDAFGDQSWKPILHPDDLQRCEETYYKCIQTGCHYQIEYRFKDRATGGYRWFLGRAYPVRDEQGQIVRWFGTCTDIDDTKRAEETLRFLADASATLAELTDYNSTLQKVASLAVPHFADWCAVDMQEPDGSVRRLVVTHVDPGKVQLAEELHRRYPPRPSDASGVTRVLRGGESEWAAEIPDALLAAAARDEEHLRLARELGLRSYICVPLRSRGRTLGALTFVTAESGRAYDAADVRAAEDLAHRAVIAVENATLLAALKDSDRRKDEFLAMLAHELRNPLAPIRNAVQIYRGKGPAVPDLQWATDVIDRQVDQMTRLVDDLLDVSRITRGKIELRRERAELATILTSAVEASRPLIEKWGHDLTVTIPPEPIYLDVDVTRVAQVVLNLLNNAAKYMDEGGRIWLAADQDGDSAVIRVKDSGVGISPEMLPRVFDMFSQEDRSLERSQGGLGIGLTLVQRLVEMQGGTVEARSDGPDKGSEFIVRLPVARDAESHKGRAAEGRNDELYVPLKHRILVVDDNRDAADSLGMLLRMMGNEVATAHDGLEAVGAAATFHPEVILLDIGLPKLNGYEVARRIRAQPGGDKMVLIALTGWGQDEDRRRTKEAGFDQHMTKPVEFDALKRALTRLSGHRPSG